MKHSSKNKVFDNFRQFFENFENLGAKIFFVIPDWVPVGVKFCFGGMYGGEMGTSLN